jgi:hypothetical protein
LARTRSTGSPKELSEKLNMSQSSVYAYLSFMKLSLNAPIAYSRLRRSYYYKQNGKIVIEFKKHENE